MLLNNRWVSEIRIKNAKGHQFNLLDLHAQDVPIESLAHQLAQINRFNGAAKHVYSVATHSVLVALLLPDRLQYDGLLHDLTEATGLGDLISPVKHEMADYQALETHVRSRLSRIYNFSSIEPAEVKAADRRAREIESHYLQDTPIPLSRYEKDLGDAMIRPEIPWRESAKLFLTHYDHCRRMLHFQN